jgi:HEAT repeat protein
MAADRPIEEYNRSRIDEGLQAAHADSIPERVEGAQLVELYIPFSDDNEKTKMGSSEYWASISRRIRAWLTGESEPWVRNYLVEALVKLDEPSDVPYLLRLVSASDPTLRRLVAPTAERHPSEDVERRLAALYPEQRYWWVKTALIEAMGAQDGDRSLEILHLALRDSSRDVRAAASGALAVRADPRSIGPLVEAMRSADVSGADSPVAALAQIKSDAVIPALAEALESPHTFVREYAAGGLGKFPSAQNLRLLARAMSDQDRSVAAAAAGSLIDFHTKEAAVQVLLQLSQYSPDEMKRLHDGWDSVFESLRGLQDHRIDLAATCEELFANPDIASSQALRELAGELRRRESEETHFIVSSADTHRIVYARENADAREVVPSLGGESAVGWKDAPYEKNGGTKELVKRGTQVTVEGAAFYAGATWLSVRDGPYGDDLWMQEADLATVGSPESDDDPGCPQNNEAP